MMLSNMDLKTRRVVTEELLRSIVWAGIGLFGWGILASGTALLEANAFTLLSVPFLTWAILTALMIGVRLTTRTELQVQSEAGLSLFVRGQERPRRRTGRTRTISSGSILISLLSRFLSLSAENSPAWSESSQYY
jgi:hypothetical protein